MLCDKCKKRPACVHITKVINSQKNEQHLCDVCAKELGDFYFSVDQQVSVHDFLKGMFSYAFDPKSTAKEIICPECKMSYSDFSRTGKIGCGVCYKTFSKEISALTKRIHGASLHTGKVPKRTGGFMAAKQRLVHLKEVLAGHVAQEEYEQAAKLRDEIREIEKNLKENGQ